MGQNGLADGPHNLVTRPRAIARWRWIVLPFIAGAAALVPWPQKAVDRVYAGGVYPHLQPIVTGVTNLVPFAILDLLVAGAIVGVVASGVRNWSRRRDVAGAIGASLVTVLNVAAGAYLAFLVLWGFNYQRTRPAIRYGVETSRVTPARVAEAAMAAATALNRDYRPARDDSTLAWAALVTRLQPLLDDTARDLGASWRARGGVPKWSAIGLLFPRAGVDGMVNPIGLEVIPNPEVLPFERPFVLAHEWAHLSGAAEESEASFVAWMVCLRGAPDLRYSGWQALLLSLLRAVPPGVRQSVMSSLAAGPRNDLQAIAARIAHAQPSVQRASWGVYDRYLRANRVSEGVASYDEVVQLALGAPAARPYLP